MPGPDLQTIADLLRQGMAEGQHPLVTVTSNSMAPLLFRGDRVRLEAVQPASLAPGDVIVVTTPESLLTHRYWCTISAGNDAYLVTRGDRPLGFDRPVPAGSLVGKVVTRQRSGTELSLRDGRGRRLNRRLVRIAQWESRWLGGRMPASVDDHSDPPRLTLWQKAFRKLLYGWACMLVVLAG